MCLIFEILRTNQLIQPIQPTNPTDPTNQSNQPIQPIQPTNPTNPTDPTDPTNKGKAVLANQRLELNEPYIEIQFNAGGIVITRKVFKYWLQKPNTD